MGDAYTSIADDEYTLFYNPAILARHKGFTFWPLNPTITVTDIVNQENSFDNAGNSSSEFIDNLFDTPIHIGINASPGFKMGRFGFSAIASNQTSINVLNRQTPVLDIDQHNDQGFIAGYGFPINGDNAIGISAKYIKRSGVFGSFNILSPRVIDFIEDLGNESDPLKFSGLVSDAFGGASGDGWGFDFGWDYVKRQGDNLFTAGFSVIDIFTNLKTNPNNNGSEVQSQPLKANLGASYLIKKNGFGIQLSGDVRNLEDKDLELRKRLRFGAELHLSPALSALAGYNSGQYSYGMKLNIGFLKTYVGLYGLDVGESLDQQVSRRALIYISLFDFNFDV